MAKTAKQLVTSALKKANILAAGETPNASDLQDGVSALQGMLDSWAVTDLLAFTETKETFTLTGDQQEYTIGAGGDFDTSRPMEVLGVTAVDPSGIELPMNPLKFDQWRKIGLKSTKSTFPTDFYYQSTWPLGRFFFFPVPTLNYQVIVYSRKTLITVADANTSVDLPPGYEDAIVYNLALELADEYGVEVSALTVKRADDALSMLKTHNLANNVPYLATEGSLKGDKQRSGWLLGDFLKGGS